MRKITAILVFSAISILPVGRICGQTIVTNLSDSLRTRVVIDGSSGIDINRLNRDSMHVDGHKRDHTGIRSLDIKPLKPREVLMVRPLLEKDEYGKTVETDIYVNMNAVRKLNVKNILTDGKTTRDILVCDLDLPVFWSGYGVISAEKPLDILEIASLNPAGATVGSLNLRIPSVGSQRPYSNIPKTVVVRRLGIDSAVIEKLNPYFIDVEVIYPETVDIDNRSEKVPVAVIDGSNWHIDASAYDIEITDRTRIELAEMKLIYNFEQSYNESIKSEVKLNDVKKLDTKQYLRWIRLLGENKKCDIQLIKSGKEFKITGEAWIFRGDYSDKTKENMEKNLDVLKRLGYDAVLVRFDCSENLGQLKKMIADIKAKGFDVFSTYVGPDNAGWNPFIEPETIERYFAEVAPECAGYFLNWRSTSNHVKILPIEYFNYLCNILRRYNDGILIYGEVYYGHIGPLRTTTMIYTVPENSTGVLLNNMGYYGHNIVYAVNNLFADIVPGYRKMGKIGQVIGVAPYYCSRTAATKIKNLTFKKEYMYKAKVEKAFRGVGCGTVTMLHDGIDDNQSRLIAEPESPKWNDTTDNILYDTKLWTMALEESRAPGNLNR